MRAILLLGSPPTPVDYAARAYSPYALLSFAFNVCGTLPGNQSTLTSFHASRFCVAPIIYSAEPVEILGVEPSSTIDGGGAGYCPRVLSVFQFVSTTDKTIYTYFLYDHGLIAHAVLSPVKFSTSCVIPREKTISLLVIGLT